MDTLKKVDPLEELDGTLHIHHHERKNCNILHFSHHGGGRMSVVFVPEYFTPETRENLGAIIFTNKLVIPKEKSGKEDSSKVSKEEIFLLVSTMDDEILLSEVPSTGKQEKLSEWSIRNNFLEKVLFLSKLILTF
ncbi:hypothetical protein KC842_00440 [Candidatus Nomurabacteria bacterium]|nr:hypothetical protein [Candidatus Nomurabacteria bacterium]USN94807.1 MAG: hypothetical protein H6791_00015 [Candidatus Nomurabacteria bacterium]